MKQVEFFAVGMKVHGYNDCFGKLQCALKVEHGNTDTLAVSLLSIYLPKDRYIVHILIIAPNWK